MRRELEVYETETGWGYVVEGHRGKRPEAAEHQASVRLVVNRGHDECIPGRLRWDARSGTRRPPPPPFDQTIALPRRQARPLPFRDTAEP